VPQSDGKISVLGAAAKAGRADTGIMLQKPVLLPWRSVKQNILLAAEMYKVDKAEAERRAARLIELVGLEGFADKYPWELSGGMQQRVSLARLLVTDPKVMLLDEPFSALDEFTRERLNLELVALHESLNRSVLYVTHNIQESVLLSDYVVVMKPRPGEIVEIVPIDIPRPRTRETMALPRMTELVNYIRGLLYTASGEAPGR
jgi:NitT/TauT family transport system ATP-binding protein